MLDKALEYAANAREAADLAGRLPTGEDRKAMLQMAETWLLLAQAAMEHARLVGPEVSPPSPAGESAGR